MITMWFNCSIYQFKRQFIQGDTVVTGGKSTIFPEGIPIGTIKEFKTLNNNYEYIDILLFNDMSSIGYVQVIKNFDKMEIINLEEKSTNE